MYEEDHSDVHCRESRQRTAVCSGMHFFVLGKARSGVISLLATSLLLSIWSHGQVGALLSLCVRTVFGTVVFISNIWLSLCV